MLNDGFSTEDIMKYTNLTNEQKKHIIKPLKRLKFYFFLLKIGLRRQIRKKQQPNIRGINNEITSTTRKIRKNKK